MKQAWTWAGWVGTLVVLLVPVELAFPVTRGKPALVFVSLLASLVLCTGAGLFRNKWFFVPSIVAFGLTACLLVSVFSE